MKPLVAGGAGVIGPYPADAPLVAPRGRTDAVSALLAAKPAPPVGRATVRNRVRPLPCHDGSAR
ncbi:hypothetical protein GCM10022402_17610 [Salinactinospora qingdaonensis]|uniref:Uncharacterized protein n=1 Tax=Salinactinospora qingdaonensis TaxID=702744 RepID=A0ABP7FEY7_9ACTN